MKKQIITILIFFAILFAYEISLAFLSAINRSRSSPSKEFAQKFFLTTDELKYLENNARLGDEEALKKVLLYYEFYDTNISLEKKKEWHQLANDLNIIIYEEIPL